MKTSTLTLKDNTNILSEEVFSSEKQKIYLEDMIKIARSVNKDPGNYADQWIDNIESLFLFREPKQSKLIGFATFRLFENKIINIPTIMILSEYQDQGLAGKVVRIIIKKLFMKRLKKIFSSPFGLIQPVYLLFRTQNPKLYNKIQHKMEIYPPLDKRVIPQDILHIAKTYSEKLWPNKVLDEESFVLKNAYKEHPSLAYTKDEVPWCANSRVNIFFEDRLRLSQNRFDSLLVVGKKTSFS